MAKATAKPITKARQRRVVPIPEPPKEAFDKDRAAGKLLQAQAVHLRHALARYVQRVARQYFAAEQSTVGWFIPVASKTEKGS